MAERKSILLRLRPDLYEELQRWAQDEFRSVNGQIEFVLDRALRDSGRAPRPGPDGEHGTGGGTPGSPSQPDPAGG